MNKPPSLPDWSLAAATEPTVRIGIVLPVDQQSSITVDLPSGPYSCDAYGTRTSSSGPVTLSFQNQADAITMSNPGDAPVNASGYTITPAPARLHRGAGMKIHDVIAGRGFHWQHNYDQTITGAIHILPSRDGIQLVNELPVEDYLAGVITAEMGRRCPPAFLEAQTIVARSWLLAYREAKHVDEPFDRCNDDCCQRYQGTAELDDDVLAVVRGTRGRVLIDESGEVVDANYSKCCGGLVEDPIHVWGAPKPGLSALVDAPAGSTAENFHPFNADQLDDYLTGSWLASTDVYCSPRVVPPGDLHEYLGRVDVVDDYFRWKVSYTGDELAALLARTWPEFATNHTLDNLAVTRRGVSGRAVEMAFTWRDASGRSHQRSLSSEYAIRESLHAGFLYSSAFDLHVSRDAAKQIERVTLRGAGWGHGAGLCQIGGVGMALCGYEGDAICRHYFPSARLAAAYP